MLHLLKRWWALVAAAVATGVTATLPHGDLVAPAVGVVGGVLTAYINLRVDITALQVRVESMDNELALLVKSNARLEILVVELAGHPKRDDRYDL